MKFRKASEKDKDSINALYLDGSKSLERLGVNQWQNDELPKVEDISKIYLIEDNKEVVATALLIDYDKDYDKIYEGSWISSGKYFAVHRFVTSSLHRQKGLASYLLEEIEKIALKDSVKSIRIDTHEDNIPMQKFLLKSGFIKCGIVYLRKSGKRIAFEKEL
ncbi:GNAT family N-acetyltransferase [Peptoniphilus catoniae]|uniref:GNAT family N-acetyltransferase n=1 Tax=Peptoniphilus catoniae TaxID=1660341 RepID=UPI0010FD594A|nr:GNAT family N-acetyltransferase [Peptoniphilus catoniae]